MCKVADTFCRLSVLIETPVDGSIISESFLLTAWSQINVKLLLMIRLQQRQQQQWPFQEA